MSFLTGTNVELIYASQAVGTALATFTTEARMNDDTGMGVQAHLPPDFWLPNAGSEGRGLHIVARGILSTTASPTFTWTVRLGASGTSAPIVLGTAALTAGATVTNQPWELEGDIIMTSIGTTAGTSTVRGTGQIRSSGLASPFMAGAFGGAASPGTVATVNTQITNFVNVNAACGTSNAANTIQLQQLFVYGLN